LGSEGSQVVFHWDSARHLQRRSPKNNGDQEEFTIGFGKRICREYQAATSREWLLANGIGGYSSSTIIGVNTRRYHGLLIAAENPPWNRKLLLSKLEEEIAIENGKKFWLSANKYPGVIYPKGHKHMWEFRLDPFPTFFYVLPDIVVKKRIFMPHGVNAVVVNYKVTKRSGKEGKIRVFPLINSRGIHEITKVERAKLRFTQRSKPKFVEIVDSHCHAPLLCMGSDLMEYRVSEQSEEERWFKNMEYERERERGYEYLEDHYNPGFFEFELKGSRSEFNLLATGGPNASENFWSIYSENPEDFRAEYLRATQRLEMLVQLFRSHVPKKNGELEYLARAADSFIATSRAIIAGYHWFSTWGRDSLIALPGLTLVTGRYEIARKILLDLGRRQKGGLIPNQFGEDWATFNAADVSLLFFYALYKYLTYTNDLETATELWPILEKIVASYVEGVKGKIRMDEDGLIWSSRGMTWMDVRIENEYVTPRQGKVVEINAQWYNALKIMEILAEKMDKENKWVGKAEEVKKNFRKKFWNPSGGYLYDVIDSGLRDKSLRPNQIFAVSLPFPLLQGEEAKQVVSVVQEKLLTPYGLRSLESDDPRFKGAYKGGVIEREHAYHQGTVWSWLLGPFITAFIAVNGKRARESALRFLEKLLDKHMLEAGIGTISEIFDGDEPHTPRGCISQAWSVGELLRCYVEDIEGKRPPFEDDYAP